MSLRAKAAQIDADALWLVIVEALDRMPDSTLVQREDWVQLRTLSSPYPHHNKILRARLDADAVDARIAEVRADHDARRAGFAWIVDEASTPADLSARLARAGIPILGSALGMVRPVPDDPAPAPPPGVRIALATRDDIERLGEVSVRGWQRPETFGQAVKHLAGRVFAGESGEVTYWLAFLDDELVGCATLRILPRLGLGYLQGACVVPHARRRGIYEALTWSRLAELQRRNIKHVVIWADASTSAPVAGRMGFQPITRATWHELPAPAT